MSEDSSSKACTKCEIVKPLEAFHREGRRSDGRRSDCKECRNEWIRVHNATPEMRELKRVYYALPEVRDRRCVYSALPEQREQRRTYRVSPRGRERMRVYFASPKGREKHGAVERTRRARKAGVTSDGGIALSELRRRDGDYCSYCSTVMDFKVHKNKPQQATVDHIVPLSRGGTDTLNNVVLACRGCNTSKGSKLLLTWFTNRLRWGT